MSISLSSDNLIIGNRQIDGNHKSTPIKETSISTIRSKRTATLPKYLVDYSHSVSTKNIPEYPTAHYASFSNVSPDCHAYLVIF